MFYLMWLYGLVYNPITTNSDKTTKYVSLKMLKSKRAVELMWTKAFIFQAKKLKTERDKKTCHDYIVSNTVNLKRGLLPSSFCFSP